MKGLARSYVWWPGIDADIESLMKRCNGCAMQQKLPAHLFNYIRGNSQALAGSGYT
ncbi:hypothetical protein DPMN_191377 [Dreissena polymorpha]|uniref:Integrase zinc-binding domain-containing protein n=1 Tax=Dreissena polymorpha TaxID=45954 RepID=A0A9D3Y112_DREPO|nr:hypothetical protein DPMN_191377 [Dreissena polymorpha]